VVAAACCFGAISTLVLLATRTGATLFTVLAWRYIIASAVLLVFVAGDARPPLRKALLLLVIGGCGQALIAGLSLSSLRWIDAATLGFLFYTYPAWVAVIAAARGLERLDANRVIALLLSLAGIALVIVRPGMVSLHPVGVTLALAAAITYAMYIPVVNWLQSDVSPVMATTLIGAGAASVFIAMSLPGGFTARLSPVAWASVVILSLVCTAAAFILFLRGLAKLGAVRTAIASTVEPFFTAIVAAIVLSQPFAPTALAGGALIAAAVILIQRRVPRQEHPAVADFRRSGHHSRVE
jgi:drug/metabolite transporter (DMT)-like permease